jgi:hypothetical protein
VLGCFHDLDKGGVPLLDGPREGYLFARQGTEDLDLHAIVVDDALRGIELVQSIHHGLGNEDDFFFLLASFLNRCRWSGVRG